MDALKAIANNTVGRDVNHVSVGIGLWGDLNRQLVGKRRIVHVDGGYIVGDVRVTLDDKLHSFEVERHDHTGGY